MDRPMPRNWWTPRRVVNVLANYPGIASTVAAGTLALGEGAAARGATEWEPGSAILKLAVLKADIDYALKTVKPERAQAVRLYYLEGMESHRGVGRALGVSEAASYRRVNGGVMELAKRLCGTRKAGFRAVEIVHEKKSVTKEAENPPLCSR